MGAGSGTCVSAATRTPRVASSVMPFSTEEARAPVPPVPDPRTHGWQGTEQA